MRTSNTTVIIAPAKWRGDRLPRRLREQKLLFLMLIPGFVLTVIFAYMPLAGWVMAFVHYQPGKNLLLANWAGLYYFKDFFQEKSEAISVIVNMLVINGLSITFNLCFGCMLAVFLNEVRCSWYKKFVQTSSFFPFFISFAIIFSLAGSLLGVTNGAFNQVLVNLGLIKEGLGFLSESKYAWGVIIGVNVWRSTGYMAVVFLAAISGIDQEQYQASEIDGAGRFAKIRHITIPGLAATFVVLLIMNAGWIFSTNFEQYYLFTNPTNIERMQVFDYYIYRYGLKLFNYSYATAVGIIKSVVSLVILFAVNWISKRFTGKGLM